MKFENLFLVGKADYEIFKSILPLDKGKELHNKNIKDYYVRICSCQLFKATQSSSE
jgi:hypothetical protein